MACEHCAKGYSHTCAHCPAEVGKGRAHRLGLCPKHYEKREAKFRELARSTRGEA